MTGLDVGCAPPMQGIVHADKLPFALPIPKPARHLLHQLSVNHAVSPGHDLWHRPPPASPHRGHLGSRLVRCHLDVPTHVPAHCTTPVGLVKVLLVVAKRNMANSRFHGFQWFSPGNECRPWRLPVNQEPRNSDRLQLADQSGIAGGRRSAPAPVGSRSAADVSGCAWRDTRPDRPGERAHVAIAAAACGSRSTVVSS